MLPEGDPVGGSVSSSKGSVIVVMGAKVGAEVGAAVALRAGTGTRTPTSGKRGKCGAGLY